MTLIDQKKTSRGVHGRTRMTRRQKQSTKSRIAYREGRSILFKLKALCEKPGSVLIKSLDSTIKLKALSRNTITSEN